MKLNASEFKPSADVNLFTPSTSGSAKAFADAGKK